jgi:transcription initiation factor TFIID subunit 9B
MIGYTAGVLKDAVIYNDHARGSNGNGPASGKNLTTEDVRLAIAARTNYQFNPVTPKELLLELAAERNKKPLPAVLPGFGIRLPPEKYCLTARDWSLSDEDDVSILPVWPGNCLMIRKQPTNTF